MDEIDMLIINHYVRKKPISSVLYLVHITEGEYDARIKKLMDLGVDFSAIDESLKQKKGNSYNQLNEFDLKVFKSLSKGKDINDVCIELNKDIQEIRRSVKKFKKFGILFDSVIKEQQKAEEVRILKQQEAIREKIRREREKEALEAERQRQNQEKKEKIEAARQARIQKAAAEKAAAERKKQEKRQARAEVLEEAKKTKSKLNVQRKRADELLRVVADMEKNAKKNKITSAIPEVNGISDEIIDGQSPKTRAQIAKVLYLLRSRTHTYNQTEIAKMLGLSKQRISQTVQEIKKLGIDISANKDKNEIPRLNNTDLKVLQMIEDGYTNSEIAKKLKIGAAQVDISIDILRENGYKFRINQEKKQFTLDSINRIIIARKLSGRYYSLKDLAEFTGISPSAVSRRLRILKDNNIIPETKHGKLVRKKTVRNAVQRLIEGPGTPKDAVKKIADYYGLDSSVVGKVAEYINNPEAKKEKKERE